MSDIYEAYPLDADFTKSDKEETLIMTPKVAAFWSEIAQWSLFFGWFLFFILLVILLGFYLASENYLGVTGTTTAMIGISSILIAFAGYNYWNTGHKIKLGLERSETEKIEEGFSSLLQMYRLSAITTLLSLLLLLSFIYKIVVFIKLYGYSHF